MVFIPAPGFTPNGPSALPPLCCKTSASEIFAGRGSPDVSRNGESCTPIRAAVGETSKTVQLQIPVLVQFDRAKCCQLLNIVVAFQGRLAVVEDEAERRVNPYRPRGTQRSFQHIVQVDTLGLAAPAIADGTEQGEAIEPFVPVEIQ